MEVKMTADNFWKNEFGNKIVATDFDGKEIRRKDFGTHSPYDWDVDHILPKSKNGQNEIVNFQIVNRLTNDQKGEKTTFTINNVTYQVKKTRNANIDELAAYDYSQKKYCIVTLDGRNAEN